MPFIPPIEGCSREDGTYKPGVFVFRNLDDCHAITRYAAGKRSAAVIGGGLLGLEAARGLQNFALEVHVIQRGDTLMNQQLDGPAGAILKKTLEQLGIHVHVDKDTRRVLGDEHVTGLAFSDGTELDCDLVVIAAGIKANSELAVRSGLTVERGIVVDNQLLTDDPRISAVGECVQHRGQVYGLVAPLWEQAKVLADALTGVNPNAAYHGSKVATKLKVMGVEVASMGVTEPTEEGDEVVQFTEPKKGTYKKLIIRNGRLIGGILLGDIARRRISRRPTSATRRCPRSACRCLFDIGAPSAKASVETMPLDMQVCNCNGVTKGKIAGCVKQRQAQREVRDGGDARGHGLRRVQGARRGGGGVGLRRRGGDGSGRRLLRARRSALEARAREGRSANADCAPSRRCSASSPAAEEDAGSKPGLASLLNTVWADEYDDERDARFINDRVHANIQKDGTFSVIPQMPGGVTSAAQLRRIADVAEKYRVPLVKLTGGQRIDLVGVTREDLPNVWRDLDMPSGFAYAKRYRTCKSCIGTDYCRFGLGDSMGLAQRVEARFQGFDSPGKLKLATAGCPRNCSEAMVKDVGVVAVEGGKWEIYVGGAAGAHVRKGDLLVHGDSRRRRARASRGASCSTTAKTPSTSSARTASSRASASKRSAPSSSTTATASRHASTPPCNGPSTRIATRGWKRALPPRRISSGAPCPSFSKATAMDVTLVRCNRFPRAKAACSSSRGRASPFFASDTAASSRRKRNARIAAVRSPTVCSVAAR